MYKFVYCTLAIVCTFIVSCKQKQPPPVPPTPVNVITVKKQAVLYYDEYPATTQALSQVNIVPEVQGYITGIFFKEGDFVKKGQKLYEIDKRLYQSAVDEAEANVKVAQGNEAQAKQDAERYTYLNNYHAVAKQLYDHAITTYENSKSQTKAAEQTARTAKTNLSYATIYAPFDGTIGFSQVKLGNMVSVGSTILNTISTNNPIATDFVINEKLLMDFEKLEQNKKDDIDSLFTLKLPNNTLYEHTGKISVIDRAVDPQTGSIKIRLVFPNPVNALKAGMSCIVRVHNQDMQPQIVVPGKAIVEQMGEYFVFVVKDTVVASADSAKKPEPDTAKGPKLYAFQKKIKVGQTIGPNVVVKSGINPGEQIVVDGVQALHQGSRVSTGPKHGNGAGANAADSNNDSTNNKEAQPEGGHHRDKNKQDHL
ncbi:MAG: efflux RND transporter periplasmic adaptor subunit [Chitinophagaceae bacterium]